MLRLLKLEYSKFRKSNVVIVLASFFILFSPLALYVMSELPEIPMVLPNTSIIYKFTSIWEYFGYVGNWMVFFFLGVMVIYMITLEVRYKTLRQSVIIGLSRQEFFMSKLLVIVVIAIFATVYYTVISLIVGWTNTSNPDIALAFSNEWAIPRFFIMSLSYMTFAMLFAYLLRNAGLAIFLYLSYVLIIESLLKVAILQFKETKYVNFLPMNATEDLMPLPLLKITQYIETNKYDFDILLNYGPATLATIFYIALFIGLSYLSIMKRDI